MVVVEDFGALFFMQGARVLQRCVAIVDNRSAQGSRVDALVFHFKHKTTLQATEYLPGFSRWVARRKGDLLCLQGSEELLLYLLIEDVPAMQGAVKYPGPLGTVQGLQMNRDGPIEDTNNDSIGIYKKRRRKAYKMLDRGTSSSLSGLSSCAGDKVL